MPSAYPKRHSTRSASVLAPSGLELSGLLALIGLYIFAEPIFGANANDTVNVVGPVLFIASLGYGIWIMVSADSHTVLTALFGFRLSALVFYGIGSLAPFFLSDAQRLYIETFYQFSAVELARLNLLVAVSVFAVLAVCFVLERAVKRTQPEAERPQFHQPDYNRMKRFGLSFTVIGSVIKYLFVFPVTMGWTADVLPGVIGTFGALSLIGIFLLAYWSAAAAPRAMPALIAFLFLEFILGLVTLSKESALLPLFSCLLGLIAQKATVLRILVAIVSFTVAVEVLSPAVAFARDQLQLRAGGQVALLDRVQMLANYYSPTGGGLVGAESGSAAMRTSLVNAATFAMYLYDSGRAGDSFEGWWTTLIPRLLWPNKPVLEPGKEFAMLGSMHEAENSVSPGIIAEAYWNFGWAGTLYIMIPLAPLLLLLSHYSLFVVRNGHWLYLPGAFIGMRVGLSIDSLFVGAILGSAVIVVWLHIGAYVAMDILRRLGLDNASNGRRRSHRRDQIRSGTAKRAW